MMPTESKIKERNRFLQSRTAGWKRTVLGLICMDIIAYKGRHISFLLMNLHIICTNALVGDYLVLKKDTFLEHLQSSRSNRTMAAILNRLMLSGQADGY